ncbi:MAG TPA: hypothetical protein VMT76_09840 [Puia sp.]|nr:hypothetical protein [Puia sp.]
MKTLKPFFSLAIIIAICTLSAILYLNLFYIPSAVLSVIWIVGITHWIGGISLGDRLIKKFKL